MQPVHQGGVGCGAGVVRLGQGVGGGMVVDEQLGALAQARGHGFEHALPGFEHGFLRHTRQLQFRGAPCLAVIGGGRALDQPQQAGLAGAVTADQADAFARLDHQVDVIEQRHMAIGQGNLGKLDQGHRGPQAQREIGA